MSKTSSVAAMSTSTSHAQTVSGRAVMTASGKAPASRATEGQEMNMGSAGYGNGSEHAVQHACGRDALELGLSAQLDSVAKRGPGEGLHVVRRHEGAS